MAEPHAQHGTGEPPADDPYRVLGVRPGAPQADIARAFRRLARTRHPDVAGAGAAAEYRRIRQAYEQLTGQAASRARTEAAGAGMGGHPPGTRIPVRVRSARPRRGRDVSARVRLSLDELITGTTRTLVLDPEEGPAQVPDEGLGQVTVRIPAGVTPGTRLRVTGQGALGSHGGAPGDLVVTIDPIADPDVTVDGRNLRTRLPVSFGQAALGARIPLAVPGHGTVHVTVPPGTQHGTTLLVPGAGLPATDRHTAGDLYVEITVHVPTELSPEARQAIADLDRLIPVSIPAPQGDQPT